MRVPLSGGTPDRQTGVCGDWGKEVEAQCTCCRYRNEWGLIPARLNLRCRSESMQDGGQGQTYFFDTAMKSAHCLRVVSLFRRSSLATWGKLISRKGSMIVLIGLHHDARFARWGKAACLRFTSRFGTRRRGRRISIARSQTA